MQDELFIAALKRALRSKGLTYQHLSEKLGVSESTIKRSFSRVGELTLTRVAKILAIAELDFFDIAKLMKPSKKDHYTLSFDQESILSEDPFLFRLFHYLLFEPKGEWFKTLQKKDPIGLQKQLKILREIGLIEDVIDQKVIHTHTTVRWQEDGPLMTKYSGIILRTFIQGSFDPVFDEKIFKTRTLSKESRLLIKKKLNLLSHEIDDLADLESTDDATLERTFFVLSFRPFAYQEIQDKS